MSRAISVAHGYGVLYGGGKFSPGGPAAVVGVVQKVDFPWDADEFGGDIDRWWIAIGRAGQSPLVVVEGGIKGSEVYALLIRYTLSVGGVAIREVRRSSDGLRDEVEQFLTVGGLPVPENISTAWWSVAGYLS